LYISPEQTSAARVLFIAVKRGFALESLPIMVIEDDPIIQAIIDEALCDGGYEPATAASGEEALPCYGAAKPNIEC
jgi:hypothetical protein